MAAPVLALDCLDGSGTAFRLINGTNPTQIGSTFGVALGVPTNPNRWRSWNRIQQTLRADALESNTLGSPGSDLYAVLYDGIYRYNAGPAAFPSTAAADAWSKAPADGGVTFATPANTADEAFLTGLHPVQINNRPHLFGVRRIDSATPDLVGYHLNLVTGAFTQGAVFDSSSPANTDAADNSGGGSLAEATYRETLHYVTAGASAATNVSFRSYNPATDTHAVYSWPGQLAADKFSAMDLFVFRDRLFAVYALTSDGIPKLMEFTGGTWTNVLTLQQVAEISPIGAGMEESQWALGTPDGINLYAFALVEAVPAGGDFGWKCYEINSAVTTVTDRTTTVLPAALRTTVDGGSGLGADTGRLSAFHDTNSTPNSLTMNVYQADDSIATTTWTEYEFQIGPLAAMTLVDLGGDVKHSMPRGTLASGHRIYTPGEFDILITNREGVVGGERLTFRAAGEAGTADKSAEFVGTTLTNPLTGVLPLTGVATGGAAVRAGNTINTIDANGVTDYTTIVDAATVPASSGDRLPIAPRIFKV